LAIVRILAVVIAWYTAPVPVMDDPFARLRRHRYGGLVEELMAEPSLVVATMFGFVTCYVHGRCMLALADKRPPWRGLLVPTSREHHAALRALLPDLVVHPVLAKWLYLKDSAASFEESARELVALARSDDPRVGVESAKFGRATGRRRRPVGRAAER
jgi:hypothetical protein